MKKLQNINIKPQTSSINSCKTEPSLPKSYFLSNIIKEFLVYLGQNKLKDLCFSDEIITSIAKKNIKNFLQYKQWKKTTSSVPFTLPLNAISASLMNQQENLNNILKKPNSLKTKYKQMVVKKETLTKSLSEINTVLQKTPSPPKPPHLSRTYSCGFSIKKNLKKEKSNSEINKEETTNNLHKNPSFKENGKHKKQIEKLSQIVSKVKNFKMTFKEKGAEKLDKLLESVRMVNNLKENTTIETLKTIYSQKHFKINEMHKKIQPKNLINIKKNKEKIQGSPTPVNISKPILSIKLMRSERKSFDNSSKLEAPKLKVKEKSPPPKPLVPKFIYYMSLLDYFIRNPNDADYFNLLYREHFLQSLAAYNYVSGLKSTHKEIKSNSNIGKEEEKKIFLGNNPRNLKTLIFDLDETLVHCNEAISPDGPLIASDITIDVKISENETITAGVNIRPFSIELLNELKESFEIVVFTASHSSYANSVIDYLDPKKEIIKKRLFREHCNVTPEGIFVKDLRIFADRKLENLILVDNALYSFGFQIENGVPIIPFYDNKQDKELLSLKLYLESMKFAKDTREINKKNFKFHLYDKFDNIEELLGKLFEGLDFTI